MEFWNKLSAAVKQKGFSAAQIKKLQEAFGHLDAAGLLRLPPDQLLPAMTGRTVLEKQTKIKTLLATVREMQAALGREQPLRLQRGEDRVSFKVRLIETDAPEKPPLRHFAISIELLNEDDKPVDLLFRGRSEAQGTNSFAVAYPEEQAVTKHVKLTVQGVDGQPLFEQMLKLDPKKPDMTVEVELAAYRKRLTGPLDEWQQATGRIVPTRLSDLFTREKIGSLADIRRSVDTLLKETGLNRQERTLLNDLIAHAHLLVLSQDAALNQALIDSGFKDIFSIAAVSRAVFLSRTNKQAGLERIAGSLHDRAVSQVELLKNVVLEGMVAKANGFKLRQEAKEPQPCVCDCQSAVGPLAYLADLLDFVLREVVYDDGELTLSQLEQFFHQPLSALPGDCSASEEIVRQVRICIEVLRSKALAVGEGMAAQANAISLQHAERAYDALLSALGTSSRELRLLRAAPEADRAKRAQSLGIAVDHLTHLLSTSIAQPFDEQALETLFGLQDTTRDPLSFGVKILDNNGRIRRWQLKGVAWKKNTSEEGRIYGKLVKQGNNLELTLSKDKDHHLQVATASANWLPGPLERRVLLLSPESGSGLTGNFEFKHDTGNWTSSFELIAVPRLLIWQFEELNRLWQVEDHPHALYDSGLPLIDPDMLAEAHFCRPLGENPAYGLWETRATALSAETERISADSNDHSYTFEEVFNVVWPATPPDWDVIASLLQNKEENDANQGTGSVTALHLTVETFNFLNDLRLREKAEADAAANGSAMPALTESEIEERAKQRAMAVDILVDVVKRRDFYSKWVDKEQQENILLTQQFFCLSAVPVTHKHPLRVSQEQYIQWQQQLAHNRRAPIVDPDIWHPLPHIGLSSGPVESFRHSRQAQLAAMQNVLDALPPAERDLKWLDTRMSGDNLQSGSQVTLHALGFSALNDLQQAFDNRQLDIQPQQHGLLPREVIALFTLRKLVATNQADEEDWQHIFHILIQAEKRRYLYPKWRREEGAQKLTLSPEFFRSPDQTLLLLLAGDKRSPEEIEWRGDAAALHEMQGNIRTRYEQRAALTESQRSVVDSAEEYTLPALRNALIDVLYKDPDGSKREQNKRDAANTLLINTFESGCRKTTRVGQAIETMQLLVWGILNRQIEDRKFTIPAENEEAFEAAWRWLQSYAAWRSAVFVYLYPENILLPSLYQSDSVVFNVVRKIMSGEIGPAAGDSAEEDNAGPSLTVAESAVVDRVFGILGKKEPTSPVGIRLILYKMLYLRHYDNSALYTQSGVMSNPYFHLDDADMSGNYWLRYDIAVQPENYFTKATVLVEPGYFIYEESFIGFLIHQWKNYQYELEDMYLLPLHGALILQQQGQFADAVELYRWVYDFQKMDFRFDRVKELLAARQGSFSAYEEWLYQDRLDPHALAKTRTDGDLRFILISIIRCLLEYAEAEFSADTTESLGRARELYFTAQRLLEHESLKQNLPDCEGSIGQLIREIGEKLQEVEIEDLVPVIIEADIPNRPGLLDDPRVWTKILDGVDLIVSRYPAGTDPRPAPDQMRAEIRTLLETSIPTSPTPDLGTRFAHMAVDQAAVLGDTLQDGAMFGLTQILPYDYQASLPNPPAHIVHHSMGSRFVRSRGIRLSVHIPGVFFEFCIPPNPLLIGLRLRTEIGLYKLSNCMNLAGMRREVPLYAAPTDTSSGLPVSGNSGALTLPGTVRLQSTQYRYKVLVERATQLVRVAQQLEDSYLSFLEKFDQETYTVLRARHDLGVSNANVTLQDLRLTEANNGIVQARQQWEKVNYQEQHFAGLIEAGLTGWETAGIGLMITSGVLQGLAAAGYFLLAGVGGYLAYNGALTAAASAAAGVGTSATGVGAVAGAAGTAGSGAAVLAGFLTAAPQIIGGLQAAAGSTGTFASLSFQLASFERRQQEWEFQKRLAGFDRQIADLQRTLAQDRYNIVQQEQTIAQLSADNAADVLHFLNNKFTNAELYSWMSGVVGEAYRYFLKQATAMAKMAQMQLTFERQETGLDYILNDYWLMTSAGASGGTGRDRRGLTGSVRLLQDLWQLDQHAFTSDKRKLQLSKTISLALHDPVAFQLFKMTGVRPFVTTHELFDRDFPGHYLRLIKRVRTTVIALVPPTQGIKATLSHTGISHAVVSREGGALFDNREIIREPESVALTSPTNDSGVFEMQEQPEMLLPFEGLGVAGSWEFRMPHAANAFNFGTIADVLVTIEYTALDSPTYRQQVIEQLDNTVSADRPFSFRHQFADAWYDLHHPDLVQEPHKPMAVSFTTRREDFPPNVLDLKIKYVTLYVALKSEVTQPINLDLRFIEQGNAGAEGGAASAVDGIAKWTTAMHGKSPVGSWTLAFEEPEIKELFANDQIEDILFVITFGGKTPDWPQ